jgi:hypothetical protein
MNEIQDLSLTVRNTMELLWQLGRFHGEIGRKLLTGHIKEIRAIGVKAMAELHVLNDRKQQQQEKVDPIGSG